MSWMDRPYAREDESRPELRIRFHKPSTAVGWLILANIAVFFIDVLSQNFIDNRFHRLFGLSLAGIRSLYLWQPLTYMFVHGSVWHLVFNMLGLYIFGTEFERTFGRERFLQFYATCGLVGGLAYLVLGALQPAGYYYTPVIGASGAVYGLLIAAIIFFPHIRIVFIIFPMPIRVFGMIVGAILLLQLVSPGGIANLGGEVCHMAGAATGLATFYAWGMMPAVRLGSRPRTAGRVGLSWNRKGAWARKQQALADEQAEVDRILAKVHEQGLQSLTRGERKTLVRATQRQKEQDRQLDRVE